MRLLLLLALGACGATPPPAGTTGQRTGADGGPEPDAGRRRIVITESTIKILEDIYFAPGSVTVDAEAARQLDEVVAILENPDILLLEVQGFIAAGEGDPIPLSRARANATAAYLVGKGVAPDRLAPRGHGVGSDADPAKNRRARFVILKTR
jgi:outer membrane protein OmpA-like peptidoglycan-associated protein